MIFSGLLAAIFVVTMFFLNGRVSGFVCVFYIRLFHTLELTWNSILYSRGICQSVNSVELKEPEGQLPGRSPSIRQRHILQPPKPFMPLIAFPLSKSQSFPRVNQKSIPSTRSVRIQSTTVPESALPAACVDRSVRARSSHAHQATRANRPVRTRSLNSLRRNNIDGVSMSYTEYNFSPGFQTV